MKTINEQELRLRMKELKGCELVVGLLLKAPFTQWPDHLIKDVYKRCGIERAETVFVLNDETQSKGEGNK